jgi:hypothetical protein
MCEFVLVKMCGCMFASERRCFFYRSKRIPTLINVDVARDAVEDLSLLVEVWCLYICVYVYIHARVCAHIHTHVKHIHI